MIFFSFLINMNMYVYLCSRFLNVTLLHNLRFNKSRCEKRRQDFFVQILLHHSIFFKNRIYILSYKYHVVASIYLIRPKVGEENSFNKWIFIAHWRYPLINIFNWIYSHLFKIRNWRVPVGDIYILQHSQNVLSHWNVSLNKVTVNIIELT